MCKSLFASERFTKKLSREIDRYTVLLVAESLTTSLVVILNIYTSSGLEATFDEFSQQLCQELQEETETGRYTKTM